MKQYIVTQTDKDIIFYQHDDLFKDGILEIQTRDKNIFNAFYTLFEKMDLL